MYSEIEVSGVLVRLYVLHLDADVVSNINLVWFDESAILHHFSKSGSLSRKIDNIYKICSFFTQDYSRKIDFGHL